MMKSSKRLVAALVALGSVVATAAVANAEGSAGGGASFPVTFLSPAITEFATVSGHRLTYQSTGSGTGKRNFQNRTFKFAGTDSAVSAAETPSFGWTYVPYLAGAIGVGYRLDELKGATLSLSKDTINGIFSGSITTWNHPSIATDMKINPTWANQKRRSDVRGATVLWQNITGRQARLTLSMLPATLRAERGKSIQIVDNTNKRTVFSSRVGARGEISRTMPVNQSHTYTVRIGGKEVATFQKVDVTLPNRPIQVVYRADTSGTTNNFCQYMRNLVNAAWNVNDAFGNCVPGGVAQFGSRFVGQPQSNNLSNYIADTNGAIGYTEVSFITDPTRAAKGMRAANIRNAAGRYVAPTSEAYNTFLAGGTQAANGFVTFDWNTRNVGAYPIGAVTYMLCQTAVDAQNQTVGRFLEWVLTDYGPKNAEALGYTPLLGAFRDKAVPLAKRCGAG